MPKCGKCGGYMHEEMSICNGEKATDLACFICGLRDSPEIRANRASSLPDRHKQEEDMRYSKYRAKPTIVDGIRFASKREAARYSELRLLEKAREIKSLQPQVKMPIWLGGKKICLYIADFTYIENGVQIVEDVKGYKTPVYKLKKKLFEALYEMVIRET